MAASFFIACLLLIAYIITVDNSYVKVSTLVNADSETGQRKRGAGTIRSNMIRVLDMRSYLTFLDPEILQCRDVFHSRSNQSEFSHVWSALHGFDKLLRKVRNTLRLRQHSRGTCNEGYSSRFPEEGYVMAKLAR